MAIQLPFLPHVPSEMSPHGKDHYVPILQNRAGELEALQRASPIDLSRTTPVIRVVGPRDQNRALRYQTVRNWVRRIHDAVGDLPTYLDVLRSSPVRRVLLPGKSQGPLLRVLHEFARQEGLKFIPVFDKGRRNSRRQLDIVKESALFDGRGVCVRYPAILVPTANSTHKDILDKTLEELGLDICNVDLWFDLAYLDPDLEIVTEFMAEILDDISCAGGWRNLIFTATSMPHALGASIKTGSIGSIDRREWTLWRNLRDAGVSRIPTFGDYAVQHPWAPIEGGGPGMRANVRYTTPDLHLIARGCDPIFQVGNVEYSDLCRRIIDSPHYRSPAYSWGDAVIYRCATGAMPAGGQRMWRGAGTSHHICQVSEQLSDLLNN